MSCMLVTVEDMAKLRFVLKMADFIWMFLIFVFWLTVKLFWKKLGFIGKIYRSHGG